MQCKFISLNLWDGGRLMDAAIEFLRNTDADIVSLQEVYNGQDEHLEQRYRTLSTLLSALSYPYHAFSVEMIDVTQQVAIPYGNAILSKFPIEDVRAVFFDIPYGEWTQQQWQQGAFEYLPHNLQHAMIRSEGTKLNVFNVHGIWGKDGVDNERRLAMSKTILEAIRGKEHVILSGDFNVKPHTKTIAAIEEQLANVFKDELVTSFNLNYKADPGFATAVVDMVFISEDIRVIEHRCLNIDVSDHLPLVCTFAW